MADTPTHASPSADVYANSYHSKTESLSKWISSVRSKAVRAKRQKRSELRRVAILSVTLRRAEDELVRKQRARAQRWARLQQALSAQSQSILDPDVTSCDSSPDQWQEEMKSIDNFFNNLNNVQIPEAAR